MNLNDYYSRSLTEANTTSIKGHILESNDKFIIIQLCFCVHHDPPNNPCPCMEGEKYIIERSDIIGNIETIESNEKDKLSTFLVRIDANIIREKQTVVKANNIAAFAFPIGPIVALLCKMYPEECKKAIDNKVTMIASRLSRSIPSDIIDIPDFVKDFLCKIFPESCKEKGEPDIVFFLPAFLAGMVAGMIIDKVIDKVID